MGSTSDVCVVPGLVFDQVGKADLVIQKLRELLGSKLAGRESCLMEDAPEFVSRVSIIGSLSCRLIPDSDSANQEEQVRCDKVAKHGISDSELEI